MWLSSVPLAQALSGDFSQTVSQSCGFIQRLGWSRGDPFSSSLMLLKNVLLDTWTSPWSCLTTWKLDSPRMSDPRESEHPRWDLFFFYILISKVTSHRFRLILFVKGESVSPAPTQEEELQKGIHTRRQESLGCILEAAYYPPSATHSPHEWRCLRFGQKLCRLPTTLDTLQVQSCAQNAPQRFRKLGRSHQVDMQEEPPGNPQPRFTPPLILSQSIQADITKIPYIGWLTNNSLLTVLETRSPRSRCQQVWYLGRAHFLAPRCPSSRCALMRQRGERVLWGLLSKSSFMSLHLYNLTPSHRIHL